MEFIHRSLQNCQYASRHFSRNNVNSDVEWDKNDPYTRQYASEMENHVVCTPILASVSVNGVLDVDQTTKLINSAKGAGEFRPLFDEYSKKFKTVQKAADPHHTWIGIDDSVHETVKNYIGNHLHVEFNKYLDKTGE